MLTAAQALRLDRRRRPRPSTKRQYDEYILQKIEAYKNSLSRDQLLLLGDEANQELHAAIEGQFVLTEILMLDSVDDLIKRRLKLKPFKKWKAWIKDLRDAHAGADSLGLEPECPSRGYCDGPSRRMRPSWLAVPRTAPAFLLAAHEIR
jgi:hypothetical protein